MELKEMQTIWSQMSDQLENKKILTNKLIMEMTRERYKNKIGIISKYEGIGAAVCFVIGSNPVQLIHDPALRPQN